MDNSFLIFNAETVNQNCDSICRLTFTPVKNGVILSPKVFYINPQSVWEATSRKIDRGYCEAAPTMAEAWKAMSELISGDDIMVAASDGFSARALWGHLKRMDISFSPMEYLNAKALARKLFPTEFSYNFDMLAGKFTPEWQYAEDPEAVTNGWAQILMRGMTEQGVPDLRSFAEESGINIGKLSPEDFLPSLTKRDYSNRPSTKLDFSDVDLNPDPENPFYGMNVVFTGKLEYLTRDNARRLVYSVGGEAPERLTNSTNFLVVGKQDLRVVGEKGMSGKMKKAAAMKEKGADIELIDESDFFEMIKYK